MKEIKASFDAAKLELNQKLEELQEKLYESASMLAQTEERAKVELARVSNLNLQLEKEH